MKKPSHFEQNLIVIGAGSGGLVAALIAAALRAEVTLIEADRMGGDCLNTGCVPSKSLIRSAKFAHSLKTAEHYGIINASGKVDFQQIMARIHRVIERIEEHDSVSRFESLGVKCIQGKAELLSPWSVSVNGKTLTAHKIIVATGARPWLPAIPGADEIPLLHSDNFWEINELPKRILILGGGAIGCEFAQALVRLGSQVTLVEKEPRLLLREDSDVGNLITYQFEQEGISVQCDCSVTAFRRSQNNTSEACLSAHGKEHWREFDQVLCALGRKSNTDGFGLKEVGVKLRANGSIATDSGMRTNIPSIYACGDVTGPFQFTHMASHQAWYATVNALLGGLYTWRIDYSVVPWAIFTDPEIARVGLSEQEAQAQNIPYESTIFPLDDLDRAIIEGETAGRIKVLTVPKRSKLLGVSIVGTHAGELITEYISAMKNGYGLNRILNTIHIYPTLSELNKFVAGKWKREHAPARVLDLLGRFHRWRRGNSSE